MKVVDVLDAGADVVAIVGLVCGVVDRDGDGQKPGQDRQNLVRDDSGGRLFLALGERVDCE